MGKKHEDICILCEFSPKCDPQQRRILVIKRKGGRDGGHTWAQQHGLLLTKAALATTTAECLARSRDQHQPLTWPVMVPSLHVMLLSRLLSVDLQHALSTTLAFHTALLLIKELASQQMNCDNRPMPIEFIDLTVPHRLEAAGLIEL